MHEPSVNTARSPRPFVRAAQGARAEMMRVAAAIGIGLFTVGGAVTWATERVIAGAILMIAGSLTLLAVVVLGRIPLRQRKMISGEPTDQSRDL